MSIPFILAPSTPSPGTRIRARLVAVLIEAVKAQQAEIEDLKDRLNRMTP